MAHKTRTSGEASLMLRQYEDLNQDLPKETRMWMALFVLAPKVGMKALEELFQRPLGQTFLRHRSWMWYTAMRHSGLEKYWEVVRGCHNIGTPMCDILLGLRSEATPEGWALLSRRLGVPVFKPTPLLNPHWYSRVGTDQAIWTKGGTWGRRNNFTRIIILGEHLERDYTYSLTAKKLGPSQAARLETEIHNLVDPDNFLFPDAINQAVAYARNRIPQLIAWKRSPASYKVAAWFFDTLTPHPSGRWFHQRQTLRYPLRLKKLDWRWLPI